ncbi:myb-related transcription factor, partner of profilin-like [Heterodontus francisci]|uniref:myb-related transcription factor, partner of profilin-like n=1 Tax=Heterodontus francisci TaxID=7792 RepID=UPI00355C94B6
MAEQQHRRQRLPKFSSDELEVLVAEVTTHRDQLFNRAHRLSQGDRDKIWQDITAKVNTVSRVRRSIKAIKTRWDDLMRRTKEVAHLAREARQIQVGACGAEDVTLEEWRVHQIMPPQPIICMSGLDPADFPYWRAIKEEGGSSAEEAGPSGTQVTCHEDGARSWTPPSESSSSPHVPSSLPEAYLSHRDPCPPPKASLMNKFDRQLLASQNQQTALLREFWEGFQPLMQDLIQATRELAHETHLVAEHTHQVAQQTKGVVENTRDLVLQNQQLVLHNQEMAQNISEMRLSMQQHFSQASLGPLRFMGSVLEQPNHTASLQGHSPTHLPQLESPGPSGVQQPETLGLAQTKRNCRTPEKKRRLV